MKKIGFILVVVIALTSCSVNTSDNVDFDGTDVVYFKDKRTGLCFGAVASRNTGSVSTTGLGLTCVPCEKVEKLIED
jgi:hypothetical protein